MNDVECLERTWNKSKLDISDMIVEVQAGDGPIGQEFFKACATWVWALLKHQHDPQLPNAAGMCVCVCAASL